MTVLPGINLEQLAALRQELDSLLDSNKEVSAALLATTDGFEVVYSGDWSRCSPSNVSAMSSSMLSLAIAMVGEAGMTPCQNLMIETDLGKVLVMSVPSEQFHLLLTVLTKRDVVFGKVLLESKTAVKQLSSLLASV